jgi:hypothetical protein
MMRYSNFLLLLILKAFMVVLVERLHVHDTAFKITTVICNFAL